ncbi:unnamed protein product [Amaranthus hypochondriacus]
MAARREVGPGGEGVEFFAKRIWSVLPNYLPSVVVLRDPCPSRSSPVTWQPSFPMLRKQLGVIAIVLNFNYLLFSVMLSPSVGASKRVSNELGAKKPEAAYKSAYVSLLTAVFSGCMGATIMVSSKMVRSSVKS